MIARMGRFVEYSVFGKDVKCDWSIISMKIQCVTETSNNLIAGDTKELTIKGGHLGPYMWPKAISMIANGDLPLEDIITHTLPLKDYRKGIEKVSSLFLSLLFNLNLFAGVARQGQY